MNERVTVERFTHLIRETPSLCEVYDQTWVLVTRGRRLARTLDTPDLKERLAQFIIEAAQQVSEGEMSSPELALEYLRSADPEWATAIWFAPLP